MREAHSQPLHTLRHSLRNRSEVQLVAKKPVPGVRFEPGSDAKPLEWVMHVEAPEEYVVAGARRKCPYGGKVFPVHVRFPHNYPFKCPEMHFKPGLLYHPNVNKETGACRRRGRAPPPLSHAPPHAVADGDPARLLQATSAAT